MKIGQRIKELRKRAKITQPELAEKIGVHETTIRRWERDIDKGPGIEIAEKIASALGTTVGVLMGETDNPEPEKTQINLPINNSVAENENASGKYLDLGYWGTVAENAKRAAKFGNAKELSLVAALLQSAMDTIKGGEINSPSVTQAVMVNGTNNKLTDFMNKKIST